MIINGCEVRVTFSGDMASAMDSIAEELERLGYRTKKQGAEALEMRFEGKWLTTDPTKLNHTVTVSPVKGGFAFRFSTGVVASYWTESDERWARQRADEVIAAVRGADD